MHTRRRSRQGSGIKWVPGYGYVTPASTRLTVDTETISLVLGARCNIEITGDELPAADEFLLPGGAAVETGG